MPYLTVNAGVRWDHEDVHDYTGQTVFTLTNEWQPRIGVVWDPRNDGPMKVYAFYGRFYYALPTDLNVRSYGPQLFATTYNFDSLDVAQNPTVIGHSVPHLQGGVFAEPHDENLKGIYQDEYTLGFETLIDPTFSIGIKGMYRRFGRAVEDRCDADPDAPENNGNTCVITNPGGAGLYGSGNFTGCNGLDGDAYTCGLSPISTALPGNSNVGAKREYKGIEVVARKSFTDKLWLQASYVYSQLRGNYDGEVKQDYGQTDPGITADFDYASFIHNKQGKLYLDRPHNFRLDATYVTPFKLSVGLQTWAQSGPPRSVIGYFNQFYFAQTQLVPDRLGRPPVHAVGHEHLARLSHPDRPGDRHGALLCLQHLQQPDHHERGQQLAAVPGRELPEDAGSVPPAVLPAVHRGAGPGVRAQPRGARQRARSAITGRATGRHSGRGSRRRLAEAGLDLEGGPVRLLCFPRVLGYVFDPSPCGSTTDRRENSTRSSTRSRHVRSDPSTTSSPCTPATTGR